MSVHHLSSRHQKSHTGITENEADESICPLSYSQVSRAKSMESVLPVRATRLYIDNLSRQCGEREIVIRTEPLSSKEAWIVTVRTGMGYVVSTRKQLISYFCVRCSQLW